MGKRHFVMQASFNPGVGDLATLEYAPPRRPADMEKVRRTIKNPKYSYLPDVTDLRDEDQEIYQRGEAIKEMIQNKQNNDKWSLQEQLSGKTFEDMNDPFILGTEDKPLDYAMEECNVYQKPSMSLSAA